MIFGLQALTPREKIPFTHEWKGRWAIQPVWEVRSKKKILCLPRIEPRFPGSLFRSLVATQNTHSLRSFDMA